MSAEVRAAAELLKAAIDRHLEACAGKGGEEDPAVQAAYDGLREAAEAYDDLLFDAFGEVTPFEFSAGPLFDPMEVSQPGVPVRVTVLQRRDFAVSSAGELVAAGLRMLNEDGAADEEELTPVEALALHLALNGVDETVAMADEIGLHSLGGTTWLLDQDAEDDTLDSAPFEAADESRLLARYDEDVNSG